LLIYIYVIIIIFYFFYIIIVFIIIVQDEQESLRAWHSCYIPKCFEYIFEGIIDGAPISQLTNEKKDEEESAAAAAEEVCFVV
jgi:hypothetical protein